MTKQIFKVVIWPFRIGMSFIASLAPLFGMPRSFFMLFVELVLPIVFIALFAQLWLNGRVVLIVIDLLFVLAVLFDVLRHLIKPRMRKDTYGTAHFATPREIKALLTNPNDTTRLLIGTYGRTRALGLTHRQQESHVLLCAPTGKGKTSSIILPGLLREDGTRSLVINDVKGELVSKTLGNLQQRYTCCLFSRTMKADQLVVLSENLPPVRVKAKPYFKQPDLKKRVNLPMILPSRPMGTEAQQGENKPTPDGAGQPKMVEKDPLEDFFLP